MTAIRNIHTSIDVPADVKTVWAAWTTNDGARSFFAPDSNIDARVDGAYEIFFNPAGEPGMRGGDDMRILTYQPHHMLSFTWNAPPSIPEIRKQRTLVVLTFDQISESETRVTLDHMGWGTGKAWDEAFEYFVAAWNDQVLPCLKYRFEVGAIDWDNRPLVESLRR